MLSWDAILKNLDSDKKVYKICDENSKKTDEAKNRLSFRF